MLYEVITQTQPWAKDANGSYTFQGDAGVRSVQVSPSVAIQASDSGHTIFETAATRRTASALSGSNNISISVTDQGAYDTYYKSNYDTSSTATNSFTFSTTAASPDTYEITDSSGTVLKSGEYVSGEALDFNGLSLTVDVTAGGSQSFQIRITSYNVCYTKLLRPHSGTTRLRDELQSHLQRG